MCAFAWICVGGEGSGGPDRGWGLRFEPALLARCTFGKHRNTLWRDVPSDYLRWAAGQQMDEDVAHTVRHELKRREQR